MTHITSLGLSTALVKDASVGGWLGRAALRAGSKVGIRGADNILDAAGRVGLRNAAAPAMRGVRSTLRPLATSRMAGAQLGAGVGATTGGIGGAYSGYKEDGLTGALRRGTAGVIGGGLTGAAVGGLSLKGMARNARSGLKSLEVTPAMRKSIESMKSFDPVI